MEYDRYTQPIRRLAPFRTAVCAAPSIELLRAEHQVRQILRAAEPCDKRGCTMNNNKIEIRNMNLYYGDFHALHGIDLDIKANEITAFIGPSGCGKSTLLRTFNKMFELYPEQRAEGEILLDGDNILTNSQDIALLRAKVGMVFQKPTPFPMSIYDNIAYGPRTHGIRSRVQLDEIVETSLRHAAIWDETKDSLNKSASIMSPRRKNAVVSETRVACCILCVTITIV